MTRTTGKPKRVAIYTRISDEKTGQDTQNQRDQLTDHIVSQGWILVKEYTDHERGWNPNRSQLKQLLYDVAQHPPKYDLVLFWSLDRLSREGTIQTLSYLQQFDRAGVAWKSLTEQYLDSSGIFRDVIISMLAVLAKQETARMSERVKAGLQRVKANGRVLGRVPVSVDESALTVMVEAGWSMDRIAKGLKVSKATVCRRMKVLKLAPAGEFTPGKGIVK